MKKSLFMLFTILAPTLLPAQDHPSVRTLSKEQYTLKSKKQATTGFILLGSGVALGTVGYFLFRDNFDLWGGNSDQNARADAGAWMFVVGGAAILTSGGFFIASGVNKGRAKEFTFNLKMERGAPIVLQGSGPQYYPAVSVRMTMK